MHRRLRVLSAAASSAEFQGLEPSPHATDLKKKRDDSDHFPVQGGCLLVDMMGSLKALQEWCRIQCEDYTGVEIKNMSTSFRDGLAFCAIIHRYRPDLIDFNSLSKENVYENNRLAFEVAETQLGIPALLDPEDMVSMNVPDRLSIITYVSQYYNFFTNKSEANPPCMKRPAATGQSEPAQKRLMPPLEDKVVEPESQPAQAGVEADMTFKRSTLSSTCTACQKHVHLVQRFLVDGKLYHRNCFRCRECCRTLLPGSYKIGNESGSLICTHHFTRPITSATQNGGPDPSEPLAEVPSARIGRASPHQAPPSEKDPEKTPLPNVITVEHNTPASDSATATPVSNNQTTDSLVKGDEEEGSLEGQEKTPPNPFEENEEEEEEEEGRGGGTQTPAKESANSDRPPTPVSHPCGSSRPVPAPRRAVEPTPPPRPAPRVRPPRPANSPAVNGQQRKPLIPPKPRERSHSPGSVSSLSSDTPKPKDPPWLALVQSETKKKQAPPPPPAGLATPPNAGSLCSLKGGGSRPGTPPPPPANPFDEDDELDEEESAGEGAAPAVVAANHPWYSIKRAEEAPGGEAPPSGGRSSRSASPGSSKGKKRPAPRTPQAPSSNQALSVESLSSGSDYSSSQTAQEHPFTKSVSEPSICGPCDSAPSSRSAERLPRLSPSPSPPPTPPNTNSAPATPQTNRSASAKSQRAPPPRPPMTPSPLASGAAATSNKRICKENPFNRKASPFHATSKTRPPRGPRPARPPAPGHGFPLIKRKVQSDEYIPAEDIHGEMSQLEMQLDELEQRGVELERKLRDNPNDEEEEQLLVEWFTLIHDKHLLVRREAELVYTAKQQNLEERQADVEYELRCLLNKPEKEWSEEDKRREKELMDNLVTIIEQRNQIINSMDQDRQRDEEEDKLMAAMLKKKDFHKEPESEERKKKGAKFKPMKVLKRLSHKGEPTKSPSQSPSPSQSQHKDKS